MYACGRGWREGRAEPWLRRFSQYQNGSTGGLGSLLVWRCDAQRGRHGHPDAEVHRAGVLGAVGVLWDVEAANGPIHLRPLSSVLHRIRLPSFDFGHHPYNPKNPIPPHTFTPSTCPKHLFLPIPAHTLTLYSPPRRSVKTLPRRPATGRVSA
jgi:hypothetical protein